MKNLIESLKKYRYLLVISLCSAFFVVVIQFVVTRLFPQTTVSLQGVFLEDAVGEILPKASSADSTQLISTLNDMELQMFQAQGIFEDTSIAKSTSKVELNLAKLLISLDTTTTVPGVVSNDGSISIKLNNEIDVDTVLCPGMGQRKNSCETYLVNKFGQSIPVTITMDSVPSVVHIRLKKNEVPSASIYQSKPVSLDIRVI